MFFRMAADFISRVRLYSVKAPGIAETTTDEGHEACMAGMRTLLPVLQCPPDISSLPEQPLSKIVLFDRWRPLFKRHPRLLETIAFVESVLIYPFLGVVKLLGPERASRLAGAFMYRIGPKLARHKRVVQANLKYFLPDRTQAELDRIGQASWEGLGNLMGEYVHMKRIIVSGKHCELVDRFGLDDLIRDRRQVLFIGAHMANWALPFCLVSYMGVKCVTTMAPISSPFFADFFEKLNRDIMSFNNDSILALRDDGIRTVLKYIKQGYSLAMMADVRSEGGERIPFFNRSVNSSVLLLAKMAYTYDLDIVPCHCARLAPARFRVSVSPPLSTLSRDVGKKPWVEDTGRRINRMIEQWIAAYPESWYWANKRAGKSFYKKR